MSEAPQPAPALPPPGRPAQVAASLLLVLAAALLSLWFGRFQLPGADEGALLTQAAKLLRGELYYRDIDAYPFPGAPYLLAGAMGLFGEHLSVARALGGAVFCGVVLLLHRSALRLLAPGRAALFGVLLLSLKFWAWPSFSGFFYWDVAFLGACAALCLLLGYEGRGPGARLVGVGAAVAVAFLSKQSLGIYLGAAVALWLALAGPLRGLPGRARAAALPELGACAAGFTLLVAPFLGYFALAGVLSEMLWSGLVRPFTGYLPTSGIDFAGPLRLWELGSLQGREGFPYFPVCYFTMLQRGVLLGPDDARLLWWIGELAVRGLYASLPLAFLGAALRFARTRREGRPGVQAPHTALALVAAAAALSALPRADFAHVIAVYPLPALLLFGLAEPFAAQASRARARSWRALLLLGTALPVLAGGALARQNHRAMSLHLELERADLWVYPGDGFVESALRWVRERVEPGAPLFVYGNDAFYYFLADRYFPWPFVQLYPGQTGGDGGVELVRRLERERPRVILQGNIRFPGIPSIPSRAPLLHDFVLANYKRDSRPFERFPPPTGPPSRHALTILHPRARSD